MKKGKVKKITTIEDLAVLMQAGFGRVDSKISSLDDKVSSLDDKIDDLAISTAKGFAGVDKRFDEMDKRVDKLEENIKATRRDVLDIGDRFVPRHEFDSLLFRFSNFEKKVMTKLGK